VSILKDHLATLKPVARPEPLILPLASQLSPEGLKVDRDTANARLGTWLREVANARVHATTGEIPLVPLEQERERLQFSPCGGRERSSLLLRSVRCRHRAGISIRCESMKN